MVTRKKQKSIGDRRNKSAQDLAATADDRRLSRKEAQILELLLAGETYGLELVRASKGGLKRGTIYTTLTRMQEKGYVESRAEAKPAHVPGIPRRLYRPTKLGAKMFAAQQRFALGDWQEALV